MNVRVYTFEEYNALLDKSSDGNVGIDYDADGWFYTVSENYGEDVTDEKVYAWLGEELKVVVLDVIVDTCKGKVAIINS